MTIDLALEKKRKLAADAVLGGNNDEALSLLNEVLEVEPHDVDALLQRAHVFWLQGNLNDARSDYKKVIKYDPLNAIAQKKIDALKSMSDTKTITQRKRGNVVPVNNLLEEPGKAKAVKLTMIGKHEEIAQLAVGEQLIIKERKHKIELRDINNFFVGYLPEDISKRLMDLTAKGALYEAFVLAIDKNEVKVLVRELKKPAKLNDVPSFIIEGFPDETRDENEDESDTVEEDEGDIDLEDESLIVHGNNAVEEEDEDDDEKDDDETYREYEE